MPEGLLARFATCKEFCQGFPDPVLIVDPKGIIVDVSGCAEKSLGIPIPHLIGERLDAMDGLGDAERKIVSASFSRALQQGESDRPELTIRTANGDFHSQLFIRKIGANSETYLICIFRDISGIRLAESKLQESEHRYQELFNNMRSGACVYRLDEATGEFVITDFNKAAEQSDKIMRRDVIGKAFTKVFPGIEKTGFIDVLKRVHETGQPEYFPPTLYEDKRIGRVWWEDYVYRLPSGEIVAAFANVTERMKALEDVEKSMTQVLEERDKMQIIVQSIADAVFVIDADSNIILSNVAASKLSGYTEEESIGKKYTDIMCFRYEGSQRDMCDLVRSTIEKGEVKQSEHQLMFINRAGEPVPIAYSAAPLKGKDGEVRGAVLVTRDITKEREIDRLKTEFVTIASHQLHAPLSGTKWFLELLLRGKAGPIPPDLRTYLEQVYASNERMISLVEDLLFISNIGMGVKIEILKQNVDVMPLADHAIKDNVDLIKTNKIDVVKEEGFPAQLNLFVDPEKLHRVFYNLISNAVKYSKPRGRVELECKIGPELVTFSVKDYGYGIPDRQKGRVFERFFRADNVITKVAEGTGLGLYIIKQIIEMHGGKIWFESSEGMGTTFYFTIPKAAPRENRTRTRPVKPIIQTA
ncbi:MAG: ATP-binding protein [Patescibacteria group bacterium]